MMTLARKLAKLIFHGTWVPHASTPIRITITRDSAQDAKTTTNELKESERMEEK